MMAQWQECKTAAKDALLLFRLGDFYEAFHEDAQIISKQIGLTLTSRQGIPMCGVPFHTAELYVDKLIAKGFKIAIAEQMENPKETKGIVKREVVRIVTPGTLVNSQLLKDKQNNFFASVAQIGSTFGLSFIDLSTGECHALELETEQELIDELFRLRPAEFLASKKLNFLHELSHAFPFIVNDKDPLDLKLAGEVLQGHFATHPLRGQTAAIVSAGSLLLYLKEERNLNLDHILEIQTESLSGYMGLDRATLRNLELTESMHDASSKNTLLEVLDSTSTPMGGRLLRHWLKHPLLHLPEIEKRQEAIASFLSRDCTSIRQLLDQVRDLERLMMKISASYATPRDLFALGASLSPLPKLKAALDFYELPIFDAAPLAQKILSALTDSPPLRMGEGEIFKDGYNFDLDALRNLAKESMSWMARYQATLREQTGIKTLKVGYTRAFGYYIEASRAQSEKIPATFHRRQTLVNGERYTTDELKKFEHQVLTAEERGKALEAEFFEQLRREVAHEAPLVNRAAKAIARLDALLSLAKAAKEHRYVRPIVDASDTLDIEEGRHPIVESAIGSAHFIANDTHLSQDEQMMLITGPNMAGKSTYLRQTALIVILAQIGSYVPATSARIGIIDKVFSRIGASDDLARGQSTFMVEMTETAHILNNATSRSLVLLDEIGRGTSTYDGISIAWSVAEYLLTSPKKQAKTLFATHYWELTRLAEEFPHAANFQTAVQEIPSGIVFLRKILPGGTDKSYGIHVAKLAGLPHKAIQRAAEMLGQLEAKAPRKKRLLDEQLPLFAPPEPPLMDELKQLDVNQLTPLQAMQQLVTWQKEYGPSDKK
jgi:DNA mismatch repair protein MutS